MTLDELDTTRDKQGFIVLKRTYSELYKRTQYSTPLSYVQNTIYEYDIRAANATMLRESGKVDPKVLDTLESLDKKAREVAVGKMITRNPEIYKIIAKGIIRAKEKLFRENGIQDYEVLSIRNDAVFIIGRKLKKTTFGNVEFRMKNKYALFQRIEKIEFLYDKKNHSIDVKGVANPVVFHPDHQKGMVQFFCTVFDYLCYERRTDLRSYLIQFTHDYKNKQLPIEYYREFSSDNIYRTIYEISGFEFNLDIASKDDLEIINPVYNYKRFILPTLWQYL